MHSKYQIWDFLNNFKNDSLKDFEGILALNTFDHVCLKIVKDHILRQLEDHKILYKMAGEIKKEWVEEEFQTLSLFSETENFFIHQANELSNELIDSLSKIHVEKRFVILSFENDLAAWKKVIKEGKIKTITIEAPKFWETNKLLDFTCSYLRLFLSLDAKSWMLEAMENNLPTMYNSCCILKLNHPNSQELTLSDVKKLLTTEKIDQFKMATIFSKRKKYEFYKKIVSLEGDFEKMRSLFMFMQSHLVKMADPSYLSLKSKLTNYDREIQAHSKLWKSDELLIEIENFNKLEILSKKKDSHLWHELKINYLRSLPASF